MKDNLPLVPSKCDLTSFPYLPIDVDYFISTKEWISFNEIEKVVFFNFILKSWHQIPSASLPNDDVLLMHFAGVGKKWLKAKDKVLSTWVLASDDRYYHPYVAKKALAAWLLKLNNLFDSQKGNEKRWSISIDSSELIKDLEDTLLLLRVLNPTSNNLDKNVAKSIMRTNQRISTFAELSRGDPNINKREKTKKILNKKEDINDQWNRDDHLSQILKSKILN